MSTRELPRRIATEAVDGNSELSTDERRNIEEARRDLVSWQGKYSKLCQWVENNIEEKFALHSMQTPRKSGQSRLGVQLKDTFARVAQAGSDNRQKPSI